MTVGELKKALKGVDDEVPVTIFLGAKFCTLAPTEVDDYMAETSSAKFCGPTGISNKQFEISAGRLFSY